MKIKGIVLRITPSEAIPNTEGNIGTADIEAAFPLEEGRFLTAPITVPCVVHPPHPETKEVITADICMSGRFKEGDSINLEISQ